MFLATIALIWGIAAVTPGPNFLVIVRASLTGDRKVAMATVAGTIAGTFVWGVAGWLGITALFAAAPFAFVALKIVGGIYIAWLGLRILWNARTPGPGVTQVTRSTRPLSPSGGFRLALATSIANPKSAVFVASLFAAALPAGYHWSQGVVAVLMMMAISGTWYSGLALVLAKPSVAQAYNRARRAIDIATGAVFLAFGAKLALSER